MEISIMIPTHRMAFKKPLNVKESIRTLQKKRDRTGEGGAHDNLDSICQLLGDFRIAVECHEKALKVVLVTCDQVEEKGAYGSLGKAFHSLCEFRKAIEYHEKQFNVTRDNGNRIGQGSNIGYAYFSLAQFESAVHSFTVLRSPLRSEDG